MDIVMVGMVPVLLYFGLKAWKTLPAKLEPIHRAFLEETVEVEGWSGAKIDLRTCTFKKHTFYLIPPKMESVGVMQVGTNQFPIIVTTLPTGRNVARMG
ncbi:MULTISPECIES: hypothetical protein [Herbaspirillum]|uniref:Uncharacterized protein n=2 Tax=Herbaspirillum huttiense TaxID=863372 RepID=A0AAJ2LVX6_9BURK|nr:MULTISPECIES: hypothetical protein [Herbaspirillum]MDR9836958.1 hypothetical protein [Herbaspirillum huttiense]